MTGSKVRRNPVFFLLQPKIFLRRCDQRARGFVIIEGRHPISPHRPRPCRIANDPRDNMQMKLRNDVAERANIDLVGSRLTFQEPRGATGFVHQLCLVGRVQIVHFHGALASWNENEPKPTGVVHQQHAAQRQIADYESIVSEPMVEGEGH
jgi:hypothetical protein